MQIQRKDFPESTVIKPVGTLALHQTPDPSLRKSLEELKGRVVINLSAIADIDMVGVGALAAAWACGDRIHFAAASRKVQEVLTATNLLGWFHVYETEEEARLAFSV